MIKSFFVCLFSLFLICETSVLAKKKFSAIAIDADTGEILFEKNPDYIGHPASLTKMFTLKMLFDLLNAGKVSLGRLIPISKHAANQAPTKLHLKPGSHISVLDAILGLITHSANDAAVAVAEFIGGSEKEFANLMTKSAKSMGMHNTIFKNASGLPNLEQVTTARDMAKLARHLVDNYGPYMRYFATTSFHFNGRKYRNHNKLLGKVDGVDCCKTGFTNASGWNLAVSAKRGDKRIIAVILGGNSSFHRDSQMTTLVNSTFKKFDLTFDQVSLVNQEEDEIGSLMGELTRGSVQLEKKPKRCIKGLPIKRKCIKKKT